MTEKVRIRSAKPEDGRAVGKLLDELGYPNTQTFIFIFAGNMKRAPSI
jgi:hypothetical protein